MQHPVRTLLLAIAMLIGALALVELAASTLEQLQTHARHTAN